MVEGHILEIRFVEVVGESLFEVDCKATVEEVEEGVDEGGWHRNETKVEYSLYEDGFVLFNDRFDDFTVKSGNVDAEEGSEDEEYSQKAEVEDFLAFPGRNDNFQQLFYSLEEYSIHVSFSTFLDKQINYFLFASGLPYSEIIRRRLFILHVDQKADDGKENAGESFPVGRADEGIDYDFEEALGGCTCDFGVLSHQQSV